MPYENVDGQNVYYELKGSGETIVFIHAPVLPSQIFQQQAVNLTKGYCVLIFDLFGHGRTSPATAVWSFAEIARTLYKLLDRLNIKQAWICGYSAGASIAFEFASLYPERTAGLIPIGAADDKKGLLLKILVRASIWACRKKLV
ncbi:alpha/beta fold hydrolase [Heyndrickxia acidiproducens]|uniref:alpha/beta fold hydrolase n=1 Tax=Heyndrickxia acidiproducens TaxID=1121084 RepID=UPI00035F5DC2|nr:alpha/beta hydrolase [Heyndrickxia acidiproducens]